jgi:CLIP-associating protein 1/2
MNGDDDNLLLASAIPIPEDSDSEPEESMNLISFSTPFEIYSPTPAAPKSTLQARSFSPKSSNDSRPTISNTLSTPEHIQGEVVEDALRARAEQAESAAERLLELVEPEDNGNHLSTIPASLLLGSNGNGNATPKPHLKVSPGPVARTKTVPPVTPLNNRNATILNQASLFKNSPAYNGTSPSLLDVLKDRKNETSWWLKRMNSAYSYCISCHRR